MRHPALVPALGLLSACYEPPMSLAEAKEAMAQSFSSARGEAATDDVIYVSTDFTLGAAVEAAAEELRAWWASQAPCAEVRVEGATVTVDFGDLSDDCTWNGHTYAGLAAISVDSTTAGQLAVHHAWTGFNNGEITLDGTADVTWTGGEDPSRQIAHDLRWDDGEGEIIATGDRTMTLVDPDAGLSAGLEINGGRAWESDAGPWDLRIDGVEVRGVDPVPQAGVYTVASPAGKTLSMAFTRIDDDTIEVVLSGLRGGDRVYEVSRTGQVLGEG